MKCPAPRQQGRVKRTKKRLSEAIRSRARSAIEKEGETMAGDGLQESLRGECCKMVGLRKPLETWASRTLEESRDEKKIELCCALWKSDDETVMWVPNKKKPRQIPFGYQCAEERRPSSGLRREREAKEGVRAARRQGSDE